MRRRKQTQKSLVPLLLIVVVVAGGTWWLWPSGDDAPRAQPNEPAEGRALAGADEPSDVVVPEAVIVATDETLSADEVPAPVVTAEPEATAPPLLQASEPVKAPEPKNDEQTAAQPDDSNKLSDNPRINASLQRYNAGEVLEARQELNRMLTISRHPAEQDELRRHLRKIADETVFTKKCLPDDPLFEMYTIQSGEYLINVGKRFNVPHEAIMLINGINDPTRIQAGQRIKMPHGPFNVKIYSSKFRLDIYLQDLYLRSYPVGLGAERGTPLGEWLVKERLPNPTYFPPASSEIKRIIPPNDPANPLGEHWIGLEGVARDAVGAGGYGIHGTIEPDKIGQAVSLGCVRMRNEDVAFLYQLMMPGFSKVTTLP